MLLANAKIQKRSQTGKASKIPQLKNKLSLPSDSTAKEIFQQMKLTQSHEINDCVNSQIQLDVFEPPQGQRLEIQTKKFTCPEWLAISQMQNSCRNGLILPGTENPQFESENDPYENSEISCNIKKTVVINHIILSEDIIKTPNLINEDKCNQFKIILTNQKGNYEDMEYKSVCNLNKNTSDSDKTSLCSIQLNKNCSTLTYQGKNLPTKSMKSMKNLQRNHQVEFQRFSEYGLKPSESNRLKKIQALQKQEMIHTIEEKFHFEFQESDQTQYFGLAVRQSMSKQRKSSAVVEFTDHKGLPKNLKKSKSRSKYSLSKGKSELSVKKPVKKENKVKRG